MSKCDTRLMMIPFQRWTDRPTERPTERPTVDRQNDLQNDRQNERHNDRMIKRTTDRQTDRQTHEPTLHIVSYFGVTDAFMSLHKSVITFFLAPKKPCTVYMQNTVFMQNINP